MWTLRKWTIKSGDLQTVAFSELRATAAALRAVVRACSWNFNVSSTTNPRSECESTTGFGLSSIIYAGGATGWKCLRKRSTAHFLKFIFSPHESAVWWSPAASHWKFYIYTSDDSFRSGHVYVFRSSAKILYLHLSFAPTWFIKRRKSTGPSTEPWGTSLVTAVGAL